MSDTKFVLEATKPALLEPPCPLSRSLLWQVQRAFFERQGVAAWQQGTVPHYATSNPYIANTYANIVFGFLRDCHAVPQRSKHSAFPPLDLSQPLYIIELGAGSGRFAYHFLKKFSGFFSQSTMREVPVQYVMTDFAGRTVDYWLEHALLKPFVESGLLDFALFDAGQPAEFNLMHSGRTLGPGTVKNPPVVIANYFFDCFPQDSFTVQNNRLHENIISLSSPQPEPDLGAPGILERIDISYESRPAAENYYDDPDFDHILQTYRQQLAGSTFTFPCAGLRCVRYFNRLSGGRMLLLSADKGYHLEESFLNPDQPGVELHGDSFSMMVNYHAIAQYTALQGGEALQTSHRHANLCIAAYLFGKPPGRYTETRQMFNEAVGKGGPDDFFTLKKGIEKHYEDLSLEQLLAYFRLSSWDANIFLGSFPALIKHAAGASADMRQELRHAIRQVWDTYYPIGEAGDLPFHMAMLLQAAGFYSEALVFYERSLQLYAPDPGTFYNMGVCQYYLQQPEAALASIRQALELDAGFEPAKSMRIKLQSEFGSQA